MKKFIIKSLIAALGLFENIVVSKFPSEWVKKISRLVVSRLKLFGEALVDVDPNDKDQLEKIAKETLGSVEFAELEGFITQELVEKIPNEKLGQILLSTEQLRLNFFRIVSDEDKDNGKQIKELFESFLHSEEFDSIAIQLTELLAEKYAKNQDVRLFLVGLVTSLVNSDDEQN